MTDKPGIVITYPFPLGAFNGGARMTREIAKSLGRHGIPVYLMPVSAVPRSRFPRHLERNELLGYEFDAELENDRVRVIRVQPHKLSSYFDGLKVRQALKQLMTEKPVAAVLSYYHESIYLPRFLNANNIPFGIIATWQSYERAMKLPSKLHHPFQYFVALTLKTMIKKSYQQAARIFPSSESTGRELVEFMGIQPEQLITCYLGVTPEFAKLPRPKPKKIKRFLFFGRLIQTKGVADAVEALKIISAKGYNDWQFDLYGDGHLDWARSIVAASGLEKRLKIHEPILGSTLHTVLSSSHLAILPSHYEAFGLAFAEAQASGLPIISYASGSIPEVVAHGISGWLAPTGDTNQLASYLIKAIEQPEQSYQMGLAGRERVQKQFTWAKTAETLISGLNQMGANLPA